MSGSSHERQRLPREILADLLDPRGPEAAELGHPVCRWCGGKLGPRRRSFCSPLCVCSFHRAFYWDALRRHLVRWRKVCADCGKSLDWRWRPDIENRAEVHHEIAVADGGTNDLDNLVLLCRACHLKRHAGAKAAQGELFVACKATG